MSDLLGYATDFGAFLKLGLPQPAHGRGGGSRARPHTSLKAVIDAHAAGNPAAYADIRTAAAHSRMIADPLAAAIAKQFPERFAAR